MNSSAYSIALPTGVENDRIVIKTDGTASNSLTLTVAGSETFNDVAAPLVVNRDVMLSFLKDAADNWEVTKSSLYTAGDSALLQSNNLSDVNDAAAARTNIEVPGHFLGNNGTKGDDMAGDIFRSHTNEMTADVTIPAGENAVAVGPLTLTGDLTVTGDLTII